MNFVRPPDDPQIPGLKPPVPVGDKKLHDAHVHWCVCHYDYGRTRCPVCRSLTCDACGQLIDR